MVRSILAGTTDYSNQAIEDIIPDLSGWNDNLKEANDKLMILVGELEVDNYWDNIYSGFQSIILYAISFFDTSQKEIENILIDLAFEVSAHHCARLKNIGVTAYKLNKDFGSIWNRDYPDNKKDYGDPTFKKVESLYCEARDMAVDLIDLANVSERLSHYVGKKFKAVSTPVELNEIVDLKPNFFGFGLNLNALIKWLFKKK